MSRECVICHGSGYGFTSRTDEEGKTVTVHMTSCASILSERRQAAAQVRNDPRVKTARTSMWIAPWDEEGDRYGPQHELPCNCPRHIEEGGVSGENDPDLTWDRVLADDPDVEYQ